MPSKAPIDLGAGLNFAEGVSEAMGLIEATGLRPNDTISDPTARTVPPWCRDVDRREPVQYVHRQRRA